MADKLRKTYNGPATTLSASITAVATSIPLSDTVSWPRDTQIDIVIDRVNSLGEVTPEKMEVMTITVDDTGGIGAVRGIGGKAQVHVAGAIVEPSVNSGAGHNDLIDAVLSTTGQQGGLKGGVVTLDTLAVAVANRLLSENDSAFADKVYKKDANGTNVLAKVNSSNVELDNSTDANGWNIRDYGSWKEYEKTVYGQLTMGVGATFIGELNTPLPVGVSSSDLKYRSILLGHSNTATLKLVLEEDDLSKIDERHIVAHTTAAQNKTKVYAVYVLTTK